MFVRAVFVGFETEWLGGFFDGEGSIGVYARNTDRTKKIKYYVLVVSLAQSGSIGEEVCKFLHTSWGGSYYLNKGKGKPQWKWNISADKAAKFLREIEPWIVIKNKEAHLGIKFQHLENKRWDHPPAIELAGEIKQCKVNY
jgi:hypothetical protein